MIVKWSPGWQYVERWSRVPLTGQPGGERRKTFRKGHVPYLGYCRADCVSPANKARLQNIRQRAYQLSLNIRPTRIPQADLSDDRPVHRMTGRLRPTGCEHEREADSEAVQLKTLWSESGASGTQVSARHVYFASQFD